MANPHLTAGDEIRQVALQDKHGDTLQVVRLQDPDGRRVPIDAEQVRVEVEITLHVTHRSKWPGVWQRLRRRS